MKLCLLLMILLGLFGCEKEKYEQDIKDEFHFYRVTAEKYASSVYNKIGIYYDIADKNKLKPLILFVHGGGWYQSNYLDWVKKEQLSYFNNLDVQFAAIDYSLSPNPMRLDDPNRVRHPAHVRDLAQAIRWIYNNASKYGIDKRKIYLLGHSSGSQMVCLVATNEKYLNEVGLALENIKGVISLDGGAYLTNTTELLFPDDDDGMVDQYYKDLKYIYWNAFTRDIQTQNDACPYLHISSNKGIPPFLLVSQGVNVPYRYIPNKMMQDKLIQNGINAIHFSANNLEHSMIYCAIGTKNDYVGNEIMKFIKRNN